MGNRHEAYWSDYSPVQRAKHRMLTEYLKAWYPILGQTAGRVVYIDCHAGRGRHATGDAGSPLLALTTLLEHRALESILQSSEVLFLFLEQDEANADSLYREIEQLSLPGRVVVRVLADDHEARLNQELDELDRAGERLAPSLSFFDPFGYQLSMALLQRIMRQPRSEVLVTLMFRYIDMAMMNRTAAQDAILDQLFGCREWRELREVELQDDRHSGALALFVEQLACDFHSVLEMRGERRSREYDLIHATNHLLGRERMKDALWKLAPDGHFVVFKADRPDQLLLIEEGPNLAELRGRMLAEFGGRNVRYRPDIVTWIARLDWRETHAFQVVKQLCADGVVRRNGTDKRLPSKDKLELEFPDRSE